MVRAIFIGTLLTACLQAQATITGTLKQQRGEQALPLPNCIVFAQSPQTGPLVGEFSDDKGNFVLQFPPDARVIVNTICPGYRMISINGRRGPLAAFDCSQPGLCAEVELTHEPFAALEGYVLDPNGLPVEDARLDLALPGAPPRTRQYMAVSDDRGYFRFFHVLPGAYQLGLLGAENLREGVSWQADPMPIELHPGDVLSGVQFPLRLDEGIGFSGRISGLPPGTTEVQLVLTRRDHRGNSVHQRAVVDPEGRFDLSGVPPGDYDVLAVLPEPQGGLQRMTPTRVGSVDLNASTGEVVLMRHEPIHVKGTIQAEWPEGFPGPGAGSPLMLRFVREDGVSQMTSARPPDYRFETDGLLPGRYQASVPGFGARAERQIGEDQWEPFRELVVDEGQTIGFTLRVRFEIGRLTVLVKTAPDTPAAHYVVGIRSNGITRLFPVDQNGRLEIDYFPAGDYQIYAWPDIALEEANDPQTWVEAGDAVREFRHEEGVDMEISLTAAP